MNEHSTLKPTRLLWLLASFFLVYLYSCQKDMSKLPNADNRVSEMARAAQSFKAKHESAEVVFDWYHYVANLQLRISPQPVYILLHRSFGYIGVALYEAVRPGIKHGESFSNLLYQMPQMPKIDEGKPYLWSASANAVLASLFQKYLTGLSDADKASIQQHEAATRQSLRQLAPEDVINRSEAFGRAVATAIYNWSTTDQFSLLSTTYQPSALPGSWVPTPPNFPSPTGGDLRYSRPFLSYSLKAVAPEMPVTYSSDPWSAFYQAAKDVYDIGKSLSAEQKAIANWWADAGGVGVGVPAPYHTIGIVTQVLENHHADLEQAAEVYAKTGIAMKDGPINTFRSKYLYNLLRPVTYIRQQIDPTWLPYLTTPPYPEYPSGLMGVIGPVTQVLIREFGDKPFTDDSYAWRGLPARHYSSLSKMAEEAALSRVYAGIHYRWTQYASIDFGRQMGNVIADLDLKNPHVKN